MHPLKLNIEIYNILRNDSVLSSSVGERIFPLVAQAGTAMPFLIYNRSNVTSSLTKDRRIDEEVQTSIDVVTARYSQGIDIAVRLDKILSGEHSTANGRFSTYIQDFSEAYMEEAFVQTVIFNHKLN
jgi:hypothetical protein